MKTFFLLNQSDYLTHFLDVAHDHLVKPASEVSLQKLNSLLELVVRTPSTVSSADPYKEDLVVELNTLSLFDQLQLINSMVGIDMKKHLQNLRAGKSFDVSNSLATPESNPCAGIKAGILTGFS
jgi:gamma-tubulin complex component 2